LSRVTIGGMTDEPRHYPVRHFAQAVPAASGERGVATLLRLVADTIDGLGPVRIEDLILHNDISSGEDDYSLTVYFHEEAPES
jgi:hypothetical protein